jgi:hypothetical protein
LEYLENLQRYDFIDEEEKLKKMQNKETLNLKISDYLIEDYGIFDNANDFIEHIRLYHIYTFYFIYNAQHKFYRRLIKEKFTFSYLFKNIIDKIKSD